MAKLHAPGSIHQALDAMMAEIESKTGRNGYEAAADAENVTKFTLYKQVDPDNPVEMSFARVVRLSALFGATSALDFLASQIGCVVLTQKAPAETSDLMGHMVSFASESAQAIKVNADALADNVRTEEELRRIIKEYADAERAAAAGRLAAQAELDALANKVTKIRGAA